MVKEVGEDDWATTAITRALAIPGLKAGINHKYFHLLLSLAR